MLTRWFLWWNELKARTFNKTSRNCNEADVEKSKWHIKVVVWCAKISVLHLTFKWVVWIKGVLKLSHNLWTWRRQEYTCNFLRVVIWNRFLTVMWNGPSFLLLGKFMVPKNMLIAIYICEPILCLNKQKSNTTSKKFWINLNLSNHFYFENNCS